MSKEIPAQLIEPSESTEPRADTEADGFFICETFRTECKRGRATFRPDWSETSPWVIYMQGTAGLHFKRLEQAADYFSAKHGMTLTTPVRAEDDAAGALIPRAPMRPAG